jgi:hypothetical protein
LQQNRDDVLRCGESVGCDLLKAAVRSPAKQKLSRLMSPGAEAMRTVVFLGGLVCLVATYSLFALAQGLPAELFEQHAETLAAKILSDDEDEPDGVIQKMSDHYSTECRAICLAIDDAATNHRDNDHFGSPLSVAISAADALRVFEAEDALLVLVDYELDAGTMRAGGVAGGDIFFPAASALVSLRVDVSNVVDAIVRWPEERSESGIRLLAWVLARRIGSLDEAKKLLGPPEDNDNIAKAVGWLEKVKEIDGLLFPTAE